MSRQPPPRRSVRESLLQLYFLRKDEIDYMRDLAHAQLTIDQKEGLTRFIEFQKAMFPWMETAQKREKDSHAEALKREIMKGPLVVSAQGGDVRRRTVKRVTKPGPTGPVNESANRVYSRLGKTTLT